LQRGQYADGNIFPHTRGRGRGRGGVVKCFTCGKVGHKYYECLDKKKEGGETHIAKEQRQNFEVEDTEGGRSLMMRKVLLTPEKEVESSV
jgi:DNA-directed RNA polymerase subunit N (RpoN/RPB10)